MAGRFSRVVRSWIFAAALTQALLPGVVSIIDADDAGSVASAAIRPHAESHGTPKCPRVHQEDTCGLCQFVSGVAAKAAAPPSLQSFETQPQYVVFTKAIAPAWLADGSPSLPRAPPAQG